MTEFMEILAAIGNNPNMMAARSEGAYAFKQGYGSTDVPLHMNEPDQAGWVVGWLDQLADAVRADAGMIRIGNMRP